MTLDDTARCAGVKRINNILAGICSACDRREQYGSVPGVKWLIPAAAPDRDGVWQCAERRFGGHGANVTPERGEGKPLSHGGAVSPSSASEGLAP